MPHSLPDTIALLRRTPAVLDALLRELPERWIEANEGGESWTVRDVVAHLIQGERANWLPRLTMILEHGESRPFEPFDRTGGFVESRTRAIADLLDEFANVRRENVLRLQELRLGDDDLARRGQHPQFGSVTASQLLATWATHDLTHLHQLTRILAHQHRDAVGPWSTFLGVLKCSAHGD